MAAAILPFLPALLAGLAGSIPGIVTLARGKGGRARCGGKAKPKCITKTQLIKAFEGAGGRIQRKRYVIRKRKGRGPVADALSRVPLAGLLLGPLARAMGGRAKKTKARRYYNLRKGRGTNSLCWTRNYTKSCAKPQTYSMVGRGLLSPAGGRVRNYSYKKRGGMAGIGMVHGGFLTHRRGYYRHSPYTNKRIHVRPTTVNYGRGLLMLPGRPRKY